MKVSGDTSRYRTTCAEKKDTIKGKSGWPENPKSNYGTAKHCKANGLAAGTPKNKQKWSVRLGRTTRSLRGRWHIPTNLPNYRSADNLRGPAKKGGPRREQEREQSETFKILGHKLQFTNYHGWVAILLVVHATWGIHPTQCSHFSSHYIIGLELGDTLLLCVWCVFLAHSKAFSSPLHGWLFQRYVCTLLKIHEKLFPVGCCEDKS